ncbi:P-loop containing nucleoside triphosphate hydrolase protein [Stachybotrys elegans]|uniref:P-loop containing nucleoside triphosphate hydrolase protein n=1 Tax=Stachybotrys elegans TaxID=80388 RepID=A0A8K0T1R5_9HYPO|nr:P-loop containing nucleoside triphosphate hydrolase protein [Stachybotrys elegans]
MAFPFLHYSFALTSILYICIGTIVAALSLDKPYTRRIHLVILLLVVASYIGQAALSALHNDVFDQGEPQLVQLIVLSFVWSWVTLRPDDPPYVLAGTAIISTLFQVPLLVLSLKPTSALEIAETTVSCIRLVLLVIITATSFYPQPDFPIDDESEQVPFHDDFETASDSEDDDAASIKRRRVQRLKETGWIGYLHDFSIFLPYLIPRKDRKVQLCFLISLGCVAANRVLNVLIPRQLGIVTDHVLASEPPYSALAVWLAMTMFDEYHCIGLVEVLAKIPIQQYSTRQLSSAAFNHVMTLSMDFHSDRDSAEVMKAIEQGQSLNHILEILVIELLPMVGDILIAVGLFWWKFNAFVAMVLIISATIFVSMEAFMLKKNMANKRESSRTEREEARVMHQAVQGWQTVSYFNMFDFERRRFAQAVDDSLDARKRYETLDAWTDVVLETLDPITFFVIASLVLYQVSQEQASAGDFVFILQYWQSLVWPIKLLSRNYKRILSQVVDAEKLLALLKTKPSVADKEDAKELPNGHGHVEFNNVNFSYDSRKPTIQDLSLSATRGQTVAFVGATGAGKSTITKLLLRFYDINSGSITIDGHDIRDVTLSSLRTVLGVVPQDPLLFNATILENLRYARPDATDEEVYEACRNAAIHDKILNFVDGYQTKVGEQGVKLSGGEIQRLAIARVFLKDPPILILDEATSAVDTETEHSIQQALEGLKKGRTTFIIAHRLSTIVGADMIMVISDGRVVESGTHAELLSLEGKYNTLWARQSGSSLI